MAKIDVLEHLGDLNMDVIDELKDLVGRKDLTPEERFRMTRLTSLVRSFAIIVQAQAQTNVLNFRVAQALAGDDGDALATYLKRAFPAAHKMLGNGR